MPIVAKNSSEIPAASAFELAKLKTAEERDAHTLGMGLLTGAVAEGPAHNPYP